MKNRADLSSNQSIREAIRRIALHGLINPSTGVIRDSAKITGYVAKIHTDGEFAGTIDVQEFSNLSIEGDDDTKIGYHEGVYLSAIQDNSKGLVIVPKMYSEVTIVTDPDTKIEYVSMFSHVDIIQLDSHEKVTIGVTEREEYDPGDENSPDIDELEETGVHARTTYKKNSAITEVQGEEKANHTTQTIDDAKFQVVVGDNKSQQLIDQEKIQLQHNKADITLSDSDATMKHGSSSVIAKDGIVYLGSESGVDDAVLGVELATILMDILNYISQIKTTTQLGPQPPLNMAQFIALKAKINSFKSSHSGFLTKKVQVQK
ncbi:hypothetical protein [Bacteroides sp. 224]|uniref:hypothetical protein n=1 Tax=Bacteroides sp. 224 TaxID=2302936 RepID=UPI0013D4ECC1|nr:hypothetical protein [Bacteroides sp. 224]NDV63944.1 hypothetical protein [Bacteroides sp. 224]